MTKDAKLGMLAGVMGVVLIAVVYYQKNGSAPEAGTPPAQSATAAAPVPAATPVDAKR